MLLERGCSHFCPATSSAFFSLCAAELNTSLLNADLSRLDAAHPYRSEAESLRLSMSQLQAQHQRELAVRDADIKSLSAIAGEIVELAGRAKINRLKPEEFTGGSLTVSNLGMYGISQFAAIINPPQAAILAVGAAEKRPVVDSDGQLAAATVMTVTLSADHRVVDGAVGARWLAAFRTLIENPVRILL